MNIARLSEDTAFPFMLAHGSASGVMFLTFAPMIFLCVVWALAAVVYKDKEMEKVWLKRSAFFFVLLVASILLVRLLGMD